MSRNLKANVVWVTSLGSSIGVGILVDGLGAPPWGTALVIVGVLLGVLKIGNIHGWTKV